MAFVAFVGQSNTGGYGVHSWDLPQPWKPDPLTLIWSEQSNSWVQYEPGVNSGYPGAPGGWAAEMQFALDFRAAYPNEELRIVKYAHGGTGLQHRDDRGDWHPTSENELFDGAAAVIRAAGAAAGGIKPTAVFWGQGEEDANYATDAQAYGQNLSALFQAIRNEWMGDPNGKIGYFRISTSPIYSSQVRDGQLAVDEADPNALSFDAANIGYQSDALHFSAQGQVNAGHAEFQMFQGWRSAAPQDPPPTGGPGQQVDGTAGADTLYGGAGDDAIGGGGGRDYMRGAEGNDRMSGGDDFDDMHGNVGDDTLAGNGGGDWVVGGQGQDLLYGDEDHDVVLGNLGQDTIDGGAGDDVLRGGQGDDVIYGWSGADFIAGDRGADTLSGGSGADTFHVFGDSGLDYITDFNAGEGDRVQVLSGQSWSVAQQGSDVVVDLSGGARVVLANVQMSSLGSGWIAGG